MLAVSRKLASLPVISRALCASFSTVDGIKNVTVLGSGLMGNGIAQVTAAAGYNVTLYDINDSLTAKGLANIAKNVTRIASKQTTNESEANQIVKDVLGRISVSTDLSAAAKSADLVIEVIIENLEIKQKVFKTVDAAASPTAIFASNTSSLSIGDISASVSEKRKTQFGGLHFFNPVPVMKLVEVIKIDKTNSATFEKLVAFGKSVGKTTVECKDTPGFIVNRLLVPYLGESIRMLERGDASKEDIDVAMKLGCGHPMGPLTLADYVGLDTTKFILDGWHHRYPDEPRFAPIPLLTKLVSEGKFGVKSGEGFYKYSK